MTNAPEFWNRPVSSPGLAARALTPLSWLYTALSAARQKQCNPLHADVPVICVGNLNVGGTGKTPTCIALVQLLLEMGVKPHIVSRGYGGQMAGPIQVNERKHSATEVGDEPLLLAAFAPTWVAKDRTGGVEAAQTAEAEVIILDDGFQNPSIHKDLSIVVVDARVGFGNGRVMPAGPLREPVVAGMNRADLVISIGAAQDRVGFAKQWQHLIDIPILAATLEPLQTGMDWAGLNVLAFAGIGRPQKFFETLTGLGANIVQSEALDDHQQLTPAIMTRLSRQAKAQNLQLVCTEKDAVRLDPKYRAAVLTVPVRLRILDSTVLRDALKAIEITAS